MKIKLKLKKKKTEEDREYLFLKMPVWKAVLKNAFPMVMIMFVFGVYTFIDSILAVQLAPDSYAETGTAQAMGPKNYIRLVMNASLPIILLCQAISLLFSVGISTRVSISLGENNKERAKNTIKTGFQIQMILSFLLILVLMFAAKPWIESQYPVKKFGTVSEDGFKYAAIIIGATPLIFINQTLSSLFRIDVRMKEMMFAMIAPIFINLLFDYVFMGALKMDLGGAAWATFISHAMTTVFLIGAMIIKKTEIIRFSNFFGKFKIIAIAGILLVGLSPFLRNFANAITQSTQLIVIQNISTSIFEDQSTLEVGKALDDYVAVHAAGYTSESFRAINAAYSGLPGIGDKSHLVNGFDGINPKVVTFLNTLGKVFNGKTGREVLLVPLITRQAGSTLSIISSGAYPIFILFFPMMLGIIQGVSPYAAYNYGAKQYDRVKQIYKWTLIFSVALGGLLLLIGGFALAGPLIDILGVSKQHKSYSKETALVLMTALPLFAFGIAGMVVLTSTDRIIASVIASSARGLILYFPILYGFEALSINQSNTWWLFFTSIPVNMLLSSIMISIMTLYVLKGLGKKKTVSLDQRIETIYAWVDNKHKEAVKRHKKLVKKHKTRLTKLRSKKKKS